MRRFAAAVAAMLLFASCLCAEAACIVQTDTLAALVDDAGGVLLSGEGIERLFAVVPNALYAAGRAGDYALYDAEGRRLGDARFEMISRDGDSLVFRNGGLYGAMDLEGGVLIEPAWTQLAATDAGWLALEGDPLDEQPDDVRFIDADGQIRETGVQLSGGLRVFSGGRMAFSTQDGRFGYLDGTGNIAIPPVWRYAGDYRDGAAVVCGSRGYGLIDENGELLLPAVYPWLRRGNGLLAALDGEGVLEVWRDDGSKRLYTVENVVQAALVGRHVAVTTGNVTRLYDADGACVLEASSGAIFAEGVDGQLILSDGEWGEACQRVIDPDGTVVSGDFQRLLPLCSGRYAYITMTGAQYYSEELDAIKTSWDYASVRYGLMDGRGEVLLPPEYLEIRAVADDRLLLVTDSAVIFADADGRTIAEWTTP